MPRLPSRRRSQGAASLSEWGAPSAHPNRLRRRAEGPARLCAFLATRTLTGERCDAAPGLRQVRLRLLSSGTWTVDHGRSDYVSRLRRRRPVLDVLRRSALGDDATVSLTEVELEDRLIAPSVRAGSGYLLTGVIPRPGRVLGQMSGGVARELAAHDPGVAHKCGADLSTLSRTVRVG